MSHSEQSPVLGNLISTITQYGAGIIVLALVIPPLTMLVYGSISSAPPGAVGVFTLDAYVDILTGRRYSAAFLNSLRMCFSVALICMVVGFVVSWLVHRTNIPAPNTITLLMTVSFFFPSFISAMAWGIIGSPRAGLFNLYLAGNLPFIPSINFYSMGGIIFVMSLAYIPLVFLFVSGPLQSLDPSMEESATLSGGSRWFVFRTITVPMVTPSLLGSGLLVFVHSLGVFGVPAILGTPAREDFLATRVWTLTKFSPTNFPAAAAIGVLMIVFSAAAILLQRRYLRRRDYIAVTARGYKPVRIPLGRMRSVALIAIIAYAMVAVVIPTTVVMFRSLVPFLAPGQSVDINLEAYWDLLTETPQLYRAVKNSLILGLFGAAACVTLCAIVAYLQVRVKSRTTSIVSLIATLPVAVPGLVFGTALIWAYLQFPIGVYGTLTILFLSFTTRFLPIGVTNIASSLVQIDPALEEAAEMSGSSWIHTTWTVLVPLLRPALLSSFILVFVDFWRELSSAVLLYNADTLLVSVLIWDLYNSGSLRLACAMAVISLIVAYGGLALVMYLSRARTSLL